MKKTNKKTPKQEECRKGNVPTGREGYIQGWMIT